MKKARNAGKASGGSGWECGGMDAAAQNGGGARDGDAGGEHRPMLRPWRSLHLAQVAARIGRSPSHIWRVLKGERKPGRELAQALSEMGFKVEVA